MEENKYTQEMLARLPREELRCLLAEELNKDTTIIDDAFVRLLLHELKSRGADPTFTDDDAVEAACEKFRTDMDPTQNPQKHWYQSQMLKVASVVLVLGILFFTIPGAVQADPVPDVLGWWSDSVLQLLRPGEKPNVQEYVFQTDHPGLQKIYDTVTELGISEQIFPRKLSKEYELTDIKTIQLFDGLTVYARLANADHKILFSVTDHHEKFTLQYEKDATNVTVWDLAGVEHYVISNKEEQIITWAVNEIECTITTDCPEVDVYKIIQSIYTLEG